jgi:protein-S-isoprenylcysteine O-methyltransferase Ste14
MQEIIYKIIFMVLFILAAFSRAPYAHKVKKLKIIKSKRKKTQITMTILCGLGMMIMPLFYVFSDYLNRYNIGLPDWARIIGIIGFAFAVFMHIWTHYALKTNWDPYVEIHKKHKLITTGPYEHIRHPMYTAFFMWSIFQGILLSNYLVLIAGVVSFDMMYLSRIKHEEDLMIEQFGNKYRQYMKRTYRLFPKFGGKK